MPDYDEGWGRESSTEGISCAKCGRVYQPTNSCESCPFCRVVELEAIVDKLPKCNRLVDGKLVCDKPVTPGMIVWFESDCGELWSEPALHFVYGTLDSNLTREGWKRLVKCFDSREAAEAAKEGMPAG